MVEKISKRKKKALAFRGKKTKAEDKESGVGELPTASVEDREGAESSWLGNDVVKRKSTKRKRDDDDGDENATEPQTPSDSVKSKSKSKSFPSSKVKPSDKSADVTKPAAKKQKNNPLTENSREPGAKRYIVFVGNLPHQPSATLLPVLRSHFPTPPTSIRIPTKRNTNAPQGFAFVEFDSAPALEKALRLHHTMFSGRKINVELTAGGGGRGETRMGKIKSRNQALDEERRKRVEEERQEKEKKEKTEKKGEDGIHPDRLKIMKQRR